MITKQEDFIRKLIKEELSKLDVRGYDMFYTPCYSQLI